MDKYLIGQRVIVDGDTIAVIVSPAENGSKYLWVLLPCGTRQWRDAHNVKPLPGGQL